MEKFPIPKKALEQHIAVLGKTGSGKTTAVKAAIEGVLDAGGRVCVIDPTSAWWGMKSSATGKSAAYPFVIFGGLHADFPLAGTHGEALAEIVGTSNTPAIIDTSQMRIRERTQFVADFAESIMRKNSGPLHLVIDEAHLFMPQGKVPDPQSGIMLAAGNNLVSGGRSRGLRIILITQRPAKLHKDALTQVETLVAMRLIAPQDRKAVEEWIKDNADSAKGREIIESLATLKTGQGWVWSPELGVLERVAFPRIRTFDSSAAPSTDAGGKAPVLAAIDKDSISQRLKVHAEAVKENDPAELKRRIRELEKQLAAPAVNAADIEIQKRSAHDLGYKSGYEAGWSEHAKAAADALFSIPGHRPQIGARPENPDRGVGTSRPAVASREEPNRNRADGARARQIDGRAPSSTSLPKAERLVLTALAQYPQGRSKTQVAILTGYAVNGGGFNNAVSALRAKGLIEGSGDRLQITSDGGKALGVFARLPEGRDLLEHWLGQLAKAERAALEVLADAYPKALSKEELARRAGYEPNGGGFNNALSRLRTLELVRGRGELLASEDLF